MAEDSETPVERPVSEPGQSGAKKDTFEVPRRDKASRWYRFKHWYGGNKKLSIPLTILVLIILLAAIPYTRYKLGGLFIKRDVSIEVVDARAGTPVSGATVTGSGTSAQTGADGQAKLHLPIGSRTVAIDKKYYQSRQAAIFVPILKQRQVPAVVITATGRQVKVSVTDIITKQALSNVSIDVAGTTAKTGTDGTALLVLPASLSGVKATLSLDGYNDASATLTISDKTVAENDLTMTPAGKIYFISNRTGQLNVMKANLDGSSPEVVLEGTSSQTSSNTAISQSPDGKYVALVTKRSDSDPSPQLYVISAADDKLLNADAGNAIFLMQGWVGDNLIYTVQRNDIDAWTTGKNKLKSYNAATGKITLLDQGSAEGGPGSSANEYFAAVFASGDSVTYAKTWTRTAYYSVNGKLDTLSSISPDGSNHKVVASFTATDYVNYEQHAPNAVYAWEQSAAGSSYDQFYDYSFGDASAKQISSLSNDQFYKITQPFYYSPSGKQALWWESRDGKNAIITGASDGSTQKVLASLDKYYAYGWYSDQYAVLNHDNSELYIMSVKGGTPLKITDFLTTGVYGY